MPTIYDDFPGGWVMTLLYPHSLRSMPRSFENPNSTRCRPQDRAAEIQVRGPSERSRQWKHQGDLMREFCSNFFRETNFGFLNCHNIFCFYWISRRLDFHLFVNGASWIPTEFRQSPLNLGRLQSVMGQHLPGSDWGTFLHFYHTKFFSFENKDIGK